MYASMAGIQYLWAHLPKPIERRARERTPLARLENKHFCSVTCQAKYRTALSQCKCFSFVGKSAILLMFRAGQSGRIWLHLPLACGQLHSSRQGTFNLNWWTTHICHRLTRRNERNKRAEVGSDGGTGLSTDQGKLSWYAWENPPAIFFKWTKMYFIMNACNLVFFNSIRGNSTAEHFIYAHLSQKNVCKYFLMDAIETPSAKGINKHFTYDEEAQLKSTETSSRENRVPKTLV